MQKNRVLALLVFVMCACTHNESTVISSTADMDAVRVDLAFTCAHEADHLPSVDPQADVLFQYARYLQKKDGPKDFNDIVRYYRIAAAHGHYKANHNAQLMISEGQADSPDAARETIALAAQLIKQGVPGGYYDIGHYLLSGYGLKRDEDAARRYIRKAADLGNSDAQYYIANLLDPADRAPEIARQMFQCASDQGYASAGDDLGVTLQLKKQFAEAIEAFQASVKAGSGESAFLLRNAFDVNGGKDPIYGLGVQPDEERSHRYRQITEFITRNDGRNPTVPDINQIVPLPPAKLPPWDGTFQWQKEQDAAIPPQKPSNDLIEQLARSTHLDPATGLQFAGKAKKK